MTQSSEHRNQERRRPIPELLILFVLSFLVHGVVARLTSESTGSFDKYSIAAQASLANELDSERYADLSPLYLELHEWMARAFSSDGDPASGGALVIWLQLLSVASAAVLLSTLLSGRGVDGRIRRLALAAFVLNPSYLLYSSIAEPETVLVFLVVLLLVLSARAVAMQPEPANPVWAAVAGVVCLACVLTRPTLLPAAVLLPIGLVVSSFGPARRMSRARALLLCVFFVLPVILGQAQLALQNHQRIGELTARVMNPGTVFYEGNNPVTWGSSAAYPPAMFRVDANTYPGEVDWAHVAYREFARVSLPQDEEGWPSEEISLSIGGVNDYWMGRALNFVVDHPGRTLRLVATKAAAVLRGPVEHDVSNAWRKVEAMPWFIPRFPFALVSLSALLGALLMAGQLKRQPMAWLELGLVASQFGAMLVFYVSGRQRLTALPLVLLLAVELWRSLLPDQHTTQEEAADSGLTHRFKVRRRLMGTAVVLFALLLSLPGSRYLERRAAVLSLEATTSLARSAQLALAEGQFNDARELTVRAVTLVPEALDRLRPAGLGFGSEGLAEKAFELEAGAFDMAPPYRQFDLALLASRAGEVEEARRRWQTLLDMGARFHRGGAVSSSPAVHLAELEVASGSETKARRLLEGALENWPGEPFALARLASLGEASALDRLERYYDPVSVAFLLGEAQCALDRDADVAMRLRGLAKRLPRLRHAWTLLAACVETDRGLARGDYWRATELQSEPVLFEERIVELFEPGEDELQDSDLALQRVQVLRQFGRIDEALDALPLRKDVASGLEDLWEFERQQLLFARGR